MAFRDDFGPNLFIRLGDYIRNNIWDAVAFLLLTAGTVLTLFECTYFYIGQPLVGLIIGLYFSWDIASWGNMRLCLIEQGLFRMLLIGGFFLTLIFSAPMLAAGIALGMIVRLFLARQNQ